MGKHDGVPVGEGGLLLPAQPFMPDHCRLRIPNVIVPEFWLILSGADAGLEHGAYTSHGVSCSHGTPYSNGHRSVPAVSHQFVCHTSPNTHTP
jgi:hypothetical protein